MASVSKHLVDYLDPKPSTTPGARGSGATGPNASSGSPGGPVATHALDGVEHSPATGTDLLLPTIDRAGLMPPLSGDPDTYYAGDGTVRPLPTSSSSGGFVPTYIAPGETFNVPAFRQALFAMTIDNEGTLDVDGYLLEVD